MTSTCLFNLPFQPSAPSGSMPFIISLLCPLFSGKNETVSPTATFNSLGENTILFFGGWLSPVSFLEVIPGSVWFGIKICFFVILYVWMRAALPRYRYDQLMRLGWKVFLPISLLWVVLTASFLLIFDIAP